MRARYTTYSGLVKGVARAPEIAEEDTDIMIKTNVTGLINMTQAVLPTLLAKNGGAGAGDVINVGSIAGREPYPGGGIYCATKAAVRSFSETLRKELIASRVRVIEIDPGQVETVRLAPASLALLVNHAHYRRYYWQSETMSEMLTRGRNSRSYDSMATSLRPIRSTSKLLSATHHQT